MPESPLAAQTAPSSGVVVSVIMPAYRQAQYISEALDSLIAQTFTGWEAIVVDDGSPDNVAEIVARYSARDSRIRFMATDNGGVSAARNRAAAEAAGEFLLPLDADDTIEPSYIERCVETFRANPDADVVYCRWCYFGATTKTPPLEYRGYDRQLLSNQIFVSAMFRRSRFLEVGGYDEAMRRGLEDWEFWIRFLSEKSVVVQLPEALFNYRIKKDSRNVEAMRRLTSYDIELYVMGKHRELYCGKFGTPLSVLTDAVMLRRKYYGLWYKRLWYGLARLLGKGRKSGRYRGENSL